MNRDKKKPAKRDSSSSNEDNSTSSEDDENAELLTEELEEGFFKVLSRLKKKDRELYEENVKFFTGDNTEQSIETNISKEGRLKKKKKRQKEYKEWLKGGKNEIGNEEVKKDLKALHDFWTNPKLNEDEQFLRDYILNQKFLEPDESFNIEEEVNKLSDEEKEIEEQMIFEHKYNCRFENQDQQSVANDKPNTKRKKNKPVEKVLENDSSLDLNVVTSKGENRESVTNAVGTELPKKKRKRKRKSLDRIISKETKTETFMKRKDYKDNLLAELSEKMEVNEDLLSKVDKSVAEKNAYEKSLKKRKRKKRDVQHNMVITSNTSSEFMNESTTNHPKKKFKRKRNFKHSISDDTPEKKENIILPKDEHKSISNLPRNQKMKNKKRKNKMRHRDRKKALLKAVTNSVSVQTGGKNMEGISHPAVKTTQKEMEKKQNDYKKHEFVVGEKKKINSFKTKKNKQFQNLIVKEKKDKGLKFSKIHSKKQKAANSVHKR